MRHTIAYSLGPVSLRIMLLAWLCLMTAGCGSSRPVMEGTVMLDGVPIEKGTIMLVPADGKGQTAGSGIEAGRYSMQASLGTMKVIIWANRKDGTMPDPANPGSGAITDRYINYVPARYNQNTELEFTVKPGRNVADFALEAAGDKTPDASPK